MSDSKDWWQGIFHIFQKRTIIVFVVILGTLSLFIILYGDYLKIFNKNIDLSEFIKLNPLYLSGLFAISIIPTALIVLIWDRVIQECSNYQENELKKSKETKMKEELKKLPIDEKEFLLRAVIKSEKKILTNDYLIINALKGKELIDTDRFASRDRLSGVITYTITIHDFVSDELEKELENHIEKEMQDLDANERNFLLNASRITESQFINRRIKSSLEEKKLLTKDGSSHIIPQMVWDRLYLLKDENNTDLNKS